MNLRRKLVVAGLGALAPIRLFAQPAKRIARIGFLGSASESGHEKAIAALREGLRALGHVEGRNIALELRWADGKYDRLRDMAASLVRTKVDVIVTQGTPAALAAKRATDTVPIVMAVIGDAIAAGAVKSLARPGGNVTGLTFFIAELSSKRLELLKEAMPRLARVGVVLNPENSATAAWLQAMQRTAKRLNVGLHEFALRGPQDIENSFLATAGKQVDALLVTNDGMLIANTKRIAELASGQHLASIGFDGFAEAGGLMSYGASLPEMFRRAAYFVDKILKGAPPGDIPVEQPTVFELVVNLKTAKILKIALPSALLRRADQLIE